MFDLRRQKVRRSKEELLRHLRTFQLESRFSVGVWCFFLPSGEILQAICGERVNLGYPNEGCGVIRHKNG